MSKETTRWARIEPRTSRSRVRGVNRSATHPPQDSAKQGQISPVQIITGANFCDRRNLNNCKHCKWLKIKDRLIIPVNQNWVFHCFYASSIISSVKAAKMFLLFKRLRFLQMKFGFWFNFIVFLEIKTKLFVTYLLV